MKIPIIFIFLGTKLPNYVYKSIELTENNTTNDIYLITDIRPNGFRRVGNRTKIWFLDDNYYKDYKFFDDEKINNFREGFWNKTITRYSVLLDFFRTENITKSFHIELGNLVFNIDKLPDLLDKYSGMFFSVNKLENYGCGNFIYINNIKSLEKFTRLIYTKKGLNDMQLLYSFYELYQYKDAFDINEVLKVSQITNEAFLQVDGIEYGLYLFGFDPRNTRGIVKNKFVFYNSSLSLVANGKYHLEDQKVFYKWTTDTIVLVNLHVHSKIFNKISKNNRLKKLVRKANDEQSSIIHIDLLELSKAIYNYLKKRLIIND